MNESNININFDGGLGENLIPGIIDNEAIFPGSEGAVIGWESNLSLDINGGVEAIEESVVVVGDGAIEEFLPVTRSQSSVGEVDNLTGEVIETSATQRRSKSSDVIEVEEVFNSGYFVVGETGEIKIDYLYDGTRPEGELAIFSLEDFDKLNLKRERDFIKEAARRALSNSELGYVLIDDKQEGAFFDGWANKGEHQGVKTFNLKQGDKYGLMLVPKGSVKEVFEKPYLGGNKKPLFSLESEEYEEYFPGKQFANVTGNGKILGIEASSVKNPSSDRDYEDLVIKIEGLTGTVSPFEEVIKPGKDWRSQKLGKLLDEYVAFPQITFDSGYFVAGESGEIYIDYLYDGTSSEGELAIFSLEDFDKLNLKRERDFIKEAARRALSNSELGYVLINDKKEGAFFDGWANNGEHQGVKSFNLKSGDEYGLMLVPNGSVEEVFNKPNLGGNKKPLFSLESKEYQEYFPGKQFADVMGNGEILGIEASSVKNPRSDRDYEDLVINIEGLTGTVSPFEEVIKPGKDWRSKSFGKKIEEYIEFANMTFDYGQFVVGETGEVSIDYLFDGGWYQGELGIFSLEGLEEKSYERFVKEAANRALSNSELGYIAIRDPIEGAKFEGRLGEGNFNSGDYLGVKTFEMNPGDKFAFMFVPHGSIEAVFNNPKIGGSKHPFFSLVTENLDDEFRPGQMGDVTGEGVIFAFEDLKVNNQKADRDYNDFVFSVKGVEDAQGVAVNLDEVINPKKDWRELELAKELIGSVKGNAPEDLLLLTDLLYNPGETPQVLGKVSDADGGNDVARIDFWLQQDGGEWQELADVTELVVDGEEPNEARFAYELAGLEAGKYRLKAIAYDIDGNSGEEVTESFTVLSLGAGEELSDRLKWAIEEAMNLDSYDPLALAATRQWVVSVKAGESVAELASSFGAENLGATGHIANTYIWELPADGDGLNVAQRLKALPEIEFAYPSVSYQAKFWSFPWHLRGDGISGNPADAHITAAWELEGVSGEGVNIAIVDDGFDYLHPDFAPDSRYREGWSWDFDENDGDPGHLFETTVTYPEAAIVAAGGTKTLKLQREQGDPRIDQKLFSGLLTNLTLDLDFLNSVSGVKLTLVSPQGTTFEVNDGVTGEYATDVFNGESPNKEGLNGVWQLKVENNSTVNVALKNWSLDLTTTNDHGTQVTGVAVGGHQDSIPASGVAPEAGWAALRLGADGFAEKEIADALSHQRDDIDIYNNSWGVGFLAEPPPLGEAVLAEGIKSGRGGLGNAFVFAAGNEGHLGDNVNYNSFANSRYTIAVGAIDRTGKHASLIDKNGNEIFYSAPGASLLVSAYSGGSGKGITTTDIQGTYGKSAGDYTDQFGGTSAAAPFVSGVVALMLDANPRLSWRDVQHILVETAGKNDPTDGDWMTNAAGYDVNHKYGFGAINGLAAVKDAKNWQGVDKEVSLSEAMPVWEIIPDKDTTGLKSSVELEEEIEVEWVEVMFDASHADRDNLKIELIHTNPDGTQTRSLLAQPFTGEPTQGNSYKWAFTSARHWGESSLGTWELRVADETASTKDPGGLWNSWQLNLFGTKPNMAPEVTNLNQELNYTEDVAIALEDIVVTDPDIGDGITVTLKLNNPAGGSITTGDDKSDAAGALSFEGSVTDVNNWLAGLELLPAKDFSEDLEVSVAVTDNHISLPLTGTIKLVGESDNDAPTVAQPIANQTATEDEAFEFVLPGGTFADVDDEKLNYSATVGGWLTFDGTTGTFSGTPTNEDVGTVEVTVTAVDAAGAEVSDVFVVTVENVNDAPTVVKEIADQTATVGELFGFVVPEDTFADADAGDSLSYRVSLEDGSPLPNWLAFDSATGRFQGTPGVGDVGSLSLKVEARDKEDASASDVFVLAVEAAPASLDLKGIAFVNMTFGALEAGDSVNVGFMVQNAEADDAGAFDVGFYLSKDGVIDESDRLLKTYKIDGLAGGANIPFSMTNLTLPAAGDEFWNGDGSYFVGMVVDVGGAIGESKEDNNASVGAGIDYAGIEVNNTEPLSPNTAPTLTAVSTLTGATEGEAYTITYEELLAASDAADADGDTLTFQIEGLLSGELTKDGETVALGETVLAAGEEIVWTPDVVGDAVKALSVKAFDGEDYSDVAVEVVVAVEEAIPIQPLVKLGDEFQIDIFQNNGKQPSVTATSDGGFIATWQSGFDVFGQRYDSSGNPIGYQFQVNSWGDATYSSVASLSNDGFVVTWHANDQDAKQSGVSGQLFDKNGNPVGEQFPVNTYTDGEQSYSSVTGLSDGGFVVAWRSQYQDGDGYGVYGQRYDSDGNSIGNEFQVNTYTENIQINPSSVALPDGGFVIVWASYGQDGSNYGIYGQRYDSNGNPIENEFQVNTYTDGYQAQQSVTSLPDGGFVVTWRSDNKNKYQSIHAQRYDVNVNKVGDEVEVIPHARSAEGSSVTSLPDGGYVVTWYNSSSLDGFGAGVFGQRVDRNNIPVEEQFLVNTYTDGSQWYPSVTSLANGKVVVTWQQDGNGNGLFAQFFGIDNSNVPPTLTNVSTLSGATEAKSFTITYEDLLNASDAKDADGNSISFLIETIGSGTLTQLGQPVTTGKTLLSMEQELIWTPDVAGDTVKALTVRAFDGLAYSDKVVDVAVAVEAGNTAPTLTQISTLKQAIESQPLVITYENLLNASNANDGDGDPISFQIEALLSGELTKNGKAIVPGETVLSEGDEIVWTPDSLGNTVKAFSVKASDGKDYSDTAVEVAIDVNSIAPFEWVRQQGTPVWDLSSGVAADSTGVYITGTISGGIADAFVSKYDFQGNHIWTQELGTFGVGDESNSIRTDGAGNVYITGYTESSLDGSNAGGQDAFVAKYNSNGNLLWVRQLGTSRWETGTSIDLDSSGNVYITGYTSGSLAGSNSGIRDTFVAKYTSSGNLEWTRQLGSSGVDYSNGIAIDSSGNVLITGNTDGSLEGSNAGGYDSFIAKYDQNGNLIWIEQFGTPEDDGTSDIATDKAGNIYVTDGNLENGAFLVKFDPSGNIDWSKQLGLGSGLSMTIDELDRIYLTQGGSVLQYDNSGNLLQTESLQMPSGISVSSDIALDNTGNVYMTGTTDRSLAAINAGGRDAWLAKLNSSSFNTPPTLTNVATLTGATESQPYTITYDNLLAASDATDADGDTLTFQIEESASGTLTKNGETIAPGETVLAAGEEIVWTPDVVGDAVKALSVKAFDGKEYSDVVEVAVAVEEPPIPTNNWNARFLNRTSDNVADRNSYNFSNPDAILDLGPQQTDGKIALNQDWGLGGPVEGIQNDNFAMEAWTRTNFEAGKLYKITTQSDDGTWFRLKNASTGEWVGDSVVLGDDGADWQNRGVSDPPRTIFFKVPETGEYDFYVDYYEKTGDSAINIQLEEAQAFNDPVTGAEWNSTVFWWDRKNGNVPPTNFHETPSNRIGTINLGSRDRSDGKRGITFDWGTAAPNDDIRLPDNNFAIRSYTQTHLEAGRKYQARVRGDDGFQLLAKHWDTREWSYFTPKDQWQQAYGSHQVVEFTVPRDGWYDFHFHHYEERGNAYFDLSWEPVNFGGKVIATIGANIRSGPSTSFSTVGKENYGANLTFDKWTKGQYIDYTSELGSATDIWYRIAGTNNWISAAIVDGGP